MCTRQREKQNKKNENLNAHSINRNRRWTIDVFQSMIKWFDTPFFFVVFHRAIRANALYLLKHFSHVPTVYKLFASMINICTDNHRFYFFHCFLWLHFLRHFFFNLMVNLHVPKFLLFFYSTGKRKDQLLRSFFTFVSNNFV